MQERLNPALIGQLPADVARPLYDRAAVRPGIVHLGVGAFQRAHLAVITEAALHAHDDARWGIVGVSLRQSDTRDALAPQGGLYTVATRDVAEDSSPRETLQVVGCLLDVLVAPDDPQAVVERIAHGDTRIVSLTVTEKGYCHDPATHTLRFDHPDITHDLAHAAAPRSAVGMLVRGLQRRYEQERGPITLMSLDNLPANGHTLQGLVLALADRVDPALRAWIAAGCTFPNSMVDRIVPRTTDTDRARICARLGVDDAWPVLGEPFLDWAVEDRFAAGRPDWSVGGARFVTDAEPYEKLKLRMVNGTHSAIAYLGAMAGLATVDESGQAYDIQDPMAASSLCAVHSGEPGVSGSAIATVNACTCSSRKAWLEVSPPATTTRCSLLCATMSRSTRPSRRPMAWGSGSAQGVAMLSGPSALWTITLRPWSSASPASTSTRSCSASPWLRGVLAVGWADMLMHYRLVRLRVEGLGPVTVAIDVHGNSV